MNAFRTSLNYIAFGALFAAGIYVLIYLGTAGDPIPKEAAMLHADMCEGNTKEYCDGVAAR